MIFAQEVDWCLKDCDKQRLQTTVSINLWKIFAGNTGDWFDVKTASICTTELWDALKSFILTSFKIKVALFPKIVSLDTLRPAGDDPGVDRPQRIFLMVCVSLSELGPSDPIKSFRGDAVWFKQRKTRRIVAHFWTPLGADRAVRSADWLKIDA